MREEQEVSLNQFPRGQDCKSTSNKEPPKGFILEGGT